jgi:hypothetical protein
MIQWVSALDALLRLARYGSAEELDPNGLLLKSDSP